MNQEFETDIQTEGELPTTSDPRLDEHRVVWQQKPTLRLIYGDYYRRLMGALGEGPILDIGGGSAHAKDFDAAVTTLDILPFPGIDVVADAQQLPFSDGSFDGILMLDVLHHLEHPAIFLKEAARVLAPGGRLAMMEPGISPLSWGFYNFLHQEPVVMSADPYSQSTSLSSSDPFDSNQAIPTLMFGRRKGLENLAAQIPEFRIKTIDWMSLVVYPLSGGFKRWCLIPAGAVSAGLALERRLPLMLRRLAGFRLFVVLERV